MKFNQKTTFIWLMLTFRLRLKPSSNININQIKVVFFIEFHFEIKWKSLGQLSCIHFHPCAHLKGPYDTELKILILSFSKASPGHLRPAFTHGPKILLAAAASHAYNFLYAERVFSASGILSSGKMKRMDESI